MDRFDSGLLVICLFVLTSIRLLSERMVGPGCVTHPHMRGGEHMAGDKQNDAGVDAGDRPRSFTQFLLETVWAYAVGVMAAHWPSEPTNVVVTARGDRHHHTEPCVYKHRALWFCVAPRQWGQADERREHSRPGLISSDDRSAVALSNRRRCNCRRGTVRWPPRTAHPRRSRCRCISHQRRPPRSSGRWRPL